MRRQISNFVYGLLDYAAYPFGMLALAPIVLRDLGAAQYGVWAVATATVSFGSIVASGFGDANIQQVATRRLRWLSCYWYSRRFWRIGSQSPMLR